MIPGRSSAGSPNAHGVPILLMNRYSQGILYVLNIPDNPGDLYPPAAGGDGALSGAYLQQDFPVRMDAPAQVSLFAYDNGKFHRPVIPARFRGRGGLGDRLARAAARSVV